MYTNVNGFKFYGDPGQRQEKIIKEVNKLTSTKIPEVENGMCYTLSIQFIIEHLRRQTGQTAEQTFDNLTKDIVKAKQLAANFRTYYNGTIEPINVVSNAKTFIEAMSSKEFSTDANYSGFSYGAAVPAIIPFNASTRALLVVFFFNSLVSGKLCGHATALVEDSGSYYFYEPNYGVCLPQYPNDIFTNFVPNIYGTGNLEFYVFPVIDKP
jgi:hypothetical protein